MNRFELLFLSCHDNRIYLMDIIRSLFLSCHEGVDQCNKNLRSAWRYLNEIPPTGPEFKDDDKCLLEWIPCYKTDSWWVSLNPSALPLLINNIDKISWPAICGNPSAFHLFEAIFRNSKEDKHWLFLSLNAAAIHLLEANPDRINWISLSLNPAAIHLLEANPDKINWYMLSKNPAAINMLKANMDKIYWKSLSCNPAAIDLLEANPDKIHWEYLSQNPAAMHLLEANPDKIAWSRLSRNPSAIHMLEANQDKVDWEHIFANPAIFKSYGKKSNGSMNGISGYESLNKDFPRTPATSATKYKEHCI